jgi:hypothetical protein
LAGELRDLVAAMYVSWDDHPARPCPPRIWADAIDAVTGRSGLRLPLENHNYLRRIAYDLADRQDRAGETARNRAERDGSARTAARRSDPPDPADRPPAAVLSPDQVRQRVADIKTKIGRRMPS